MSRVEFVRRFALHILPKGFTKIRHYGLLAPGNIKGAFKQAWEAAMASETERERQERCTRETSKRSTHSDATEEDAESRLFVRRCPKCGRHSFRPSLSRQRPEVPEWVPSVLALGQRGRKSVQISLWRG